MSLIARTSPDDARLLDVLRDWLPTRRWFPAKGASTELSTVGSQQVNASFGITSRGAQLELMFWVRNLNKDDSLISTFPTVAQDGSYSGYPNQPRTYGATLRKTF